MPQPGADVEFAALRAVMRDELYLSSRTSALPYQAHPERLSVRECRVLQLLKMGFTVDEIAKVLHITTKTVYRSREKLKDSLGVRTNEQIVPTAQSRGWL